MDRYGPERVVGRMADGDPAALEALYDRTAAGVYGAALQAAPTATAARHTTRQVYAEAWDRASALDTGHRSPEAWIYAIARRLAGVVTEPTVARSPIITDTVTNSPEISRALQAAALGDTNAFEVLYEATAAAVFGVVKRIVVDRQMAEDVTQEVFVEVWHKAHTFDPDRGSAKAWIYTLARRRAIDLVRSEQAERDRREKVAEPEMTRSNDPVGEHVAAVAGADGVAKALESLTDLQREVITLAYFGGLTQSQIAEHLDIPLGTAKTRIRDGLMSLRTTMGASP